MKNKESDVRNDKEGLNMNAAVQEYGYLDLSKLRTRISKTLSTEEALQDVTPINWSNDVVSGEKKVQISKVKDK